MKVLRILSSRVIIALSLVSPLSLGADITADNEFDAGSKVSLNTLSAQQIESLLTLGKVWGFLKYRPPVVTSGQRDWDYDLFRVLPTALAARDHCVAKFPKIVQTLSF